MSIASAPATFPSPLAASKTAMSSVRTRFVAAVVMLGCAAILGLAAWLTPSPNGLGTHSQLNLPPCGWIVMMDMPCPTCGMTTAFAHAAHGDLWASFLAQPMGCVLAIVTAMMFWVSLYITATGS